jgi:hypothetical protein
MNFCVGASSCAVEKAKSLPASHSPSVVKYWSQWWKPPPKLNPAQKERPTPRRMMTFTAASRIASRIARSISSGIGGTIVLSSSGRFSVIVATGPSVE